MSESIIGVIGGTGLYEMEGLENIERIEIDTPYGKPSDAYILGTLAGKKMAFLPRHGTGHRILPHELNFRANIWGMKKLGVEQLISVSAVGSMKEDIEPGHIVFVDQFIDRTRMRPSTFYGDGIVVHVGFADPTVDRMRNHLKKCADELDIVNHDGGAYVCIEGPQFSTRAESIMYRGWGVSVVGMTNMPEARLAREAEIGYATIALATDYDCWHDGHDDVTVDAVMAVLRDNAEKAKRIIVRYVETVQDNLLQGHEAVTAARMGLMTDAAVIPEQRKKDLEPILGPIFAARLAAQSQS